MPTVCVAAYEVLSDAEKRRIYDRYGEEGLKEHEGRGGRGGGGGAQDIFSQCASGLNLPGRCCEPTQHEWVHA